MGLWYQPPARGAGGRWFASSCTRFVPFVGSPQGQREEIWAYGLRNPWKMAFDPNNGALWVGDVGQDEWEEINIIEKGGNYGWRIMEGAHCFPTATPECDTDGKTLPIFEYSHDSGACSITGGPIYRGSRLPSLAGAYLYADWCTGEVWAPRYDYDNQEVIEQGLVIGTGMPIPTFGEDEQGNMYLVASTGGANIYRLVDPASVPSLSTVALVLTAIAFAIVIGLRLRRNAVLF